MPGSLSTPTLRSLAREAGVSPMTVSLALRQSSEVSAATRQRILKLARVRGYRPDPQIAKLMMHLRMRRPARAATNLCGLYQHWFQTPAPQGNYFERLTAGLRERAASLGYSFSLLNLDEYPRSGQLQRVLASRGIEGLLLLPMRDYSDLSSWLDWQNFSTVCVTSTVSAPLFHRVMPRHFENMMQACRELTRSGYRRIGMAMSKMWDIRINHRWTAGFLWQNQFGGTEPVTPLLEESTSLNLDPQTFVRWVNAERPDAVVFESLDSSVLVRALREIPPSKHPAIVSMNWPSVSADGGIDQRVEQVGAVAVEVLAGMLNRGEKGIPVLPNVTTITGAWVPGRLKTSATRSRQSQPRRRTPPAIKARSTAR